MQLITQTIARYRDKLRHRFSFDRSEGGFALLFTIVIVSVVLAFALTILELTIKQVVLSSVVRDSTAAYHVANAGFECIQNWRKYHPTDSTLPSNMDCLGETDNAASKSVSPPAALSSETLYKGLQFEIATESSNDICAEIDVLIIDNSTESAAITAIEEAGVSLPFPDPTPDSDYECSAGNVCTFVFSRGMNRACGEGGTGVVQREVFGRF